MKSVGFIWDLCKINWALRYHLKNEKKWSCKLTSFNLKDKKYNLKNYKKLSCKLISFNFKNENCYLKNEKKKWSCNAGLRRNKHMDRHAFVRVGDFLKKDRLLPFNMLSEAVRCM